MAKKSKAKIVTKGNYACVVCGRGANGPVYCCGSSIIKPHLPKRMVKKRR
jgi:hypothetical protein